MSKHLLVISIGPVQKFISAARRTRDLWFGSYALSEISKAAARAIAEAGGTLVFPAPRTPGELNRDSPLNVANVVLAELDGGDPEAVAATAKAAAEQAWLDFAQDARQKAGAVIRDDIWKDQVGDVIEFNAAWVAATGQYTEDRKRLMRLLAGRKQCFDFSPAKGLPGVPKSSLDGLRESVLKKSDATGTSTAAGIRLAAGEQLDVVGVVKRCAGKTQAYPSVARIAADPWLRGLADDNRGKLTAACAPLPGLKIYPQFEPFLFDGTVCFPSRFSELKAEGEIDGSIEGLRQVVRSLECGESDPYLAVLVADGDRVGAALSDIPNADGHRAFSQALAQFSSSAAKIISRHYGVAVYCGGDDVLALVPVDWVLGCAAKLARAFQERMANVGAGAPPTLSVGVAIGHFMEPLEDLLEYGRAAEGHAKNPRPADGRQNPRNGLAVHLHKRGGGPVFFRDNWESKPEEHLVTLAENLNAGTLSHRIAADLERLAGVYDGWPGETVKRAITKDTLRVLAAKSPRQSDDRQRMDALKELVKQTVKDSATLRQLANGLLIARQLASALRQAAGKRAKGELD